MNYSWLFMVKWVKGQDRAKTKTSLKPPPHVSPVAEAFGVVCGPTGWFGPWCCKTWPGKRTTFRVGDGPKLVFCFFFYLSNAQKLRLMFFPRILLLASWMEILYLSTWPKGAKTVLKTWVSKRKCKTKLVFSTKINPGQWLYLPLLTDTGSWRALQSFNQMALEYFWIYEYVSVSF